ncbi:hypothetical protein NHQ30_011136 [Ciborinia camelliae]|nr:hypothetical protein NHQ30_011136 [Ciborinia camelliae]
MGRNQPNYAENRSATIGSMKSPQNGCTSISQHGLATLSAPTLEIADARSTPEPAVLAKGKFTSPAGHIVGMTKAYMTQVRESIIDAMEVCCRWGSRIISASIINVAYSHTAIQVYCRKIRLHKVTILYASRTPLKCYPQRAPASRPLIRRVYYYEL